MATSLTLERLHSSSWYAVLSQVFGGNRYHRKEEIIRCSWCGSESDLRTGKPYCARGASNPKHSNARIYWSYVRVVR